VSEWLEQAGRRLAVEVEALLDLARVTAHDSGERTNAPLVCYLLGLARGRHPELGLGALAAKASGEGG
jgi:Domain of unknown function (DUF6457)